MNTKDQNPEKQSNQARVRRTRAEVESELRENAAEVVRLERAEAEHQARVSAMQQALRGIGGSAVGTLNTLQSIIYDWNATQGFWSGDAGHTGTKIALMHSELSEALEADRKGILSDDKIPAYSGLEAELADAVIRILDFAGRHNLRLGEAMIEKLAFNTSRPYKHGKAY